MKIKNLLKTTGKNILVIMFGAVGGAILSVICGLQFWLPKQMANLSGLDALFGAVALIIVTIIIFGILGLVVGGILAVIFYQIFKRRKKGKK